ncbi:2-haloacrylate reductase-like [Pyrus x bretschneideri]|uniref:2-haloacrylate reductase-like n=1 Tax=Pyrus x bretschneideri TaxID=225117 RepID=UPI002030ADC6|nr:2-haloacrylate reductase-like [Pyrus x bretschneideri]
MYKPKLISGVEACGIVTAVGPGLTGRQVGDLVAYAGQQMGSYAEEQILPANRAVPVPPSIDPKVAASLMLKGTTAQFLLRRCFKVEPGHTVLVHAAVGGVGSLLCQWANALGATVIGTVSTKEKAAQAKEDGCHHVIIYKEEDFVTRVKEITSNNGVEVVYDSVGKDTFEGSLEVLKLRGYMVSFGQSSGAPDPVPLSAIAAKSLFLTRPSLFDRSIFIQGNLPVEKWVETTSWFLGKESAAWWEQESRRLTTAEKTDWDVFQELFRRRFVPLEYIDRKKQEFTELRQRKLTANEYYRNSNMRFSVVPGRTNSAGGDRFE